MAGIPRGAAPLALALALLHSSAQCHVTYRITDLGEGCGYSINEKGQVTGWAMHRDIGREYAFLYSNGQMIDMGTLGGSLAYGYGINNAGLAVGQSDTSNSWPYPNEAFLYSNGVMHHLGGLGGATSCAWAINDAGVAAGEAGSAADGYLHAVSFAGGHVTDLGFLGGTRASARAINNAGLIAGYSALPNGFSHAFAYSNGSMSDLGTLGGLGSVAMGINDAGWIVGDADATDGRSHAFLYADGVMNDLGMMGGTWASAYDVNNAGQVVGDTSSVGAFVYEDGEMVALNSLLDPASAGWSLRDARGINDAGQIVGWGTIPQDPGIDHAFIATPVPEPSMLCAVIPALLLGLRRRRRS